MTTGHTERQMVILEIMVEIDIPNNWYQKGQGSLGSVGKREFVFTNFQADKYCTSSGDGEENCVYS